MNLNMLRRRPQPKHPLTSDTFSTEKELHRALAFTLVYLILTPPRDVVLHL